MRDAREIIRLKASSVSTHEIARRLGMARSTVRETLKRAQTAGLFWPLPEAMNDGALEAALYASRRSKRGHRRIEEPDWASVHRELKRKHVTLLILWDEYIAANPGGYSYSRYVAARLMWLPDALPVASWKVGTRLTQHKSGLRLADLTHFEVRHGSSVFSRQHRRLSVSRRTICRRAEPLSQPLRGTRREAHGPKGQAQRTPMDSATSRPGRGPRRRHDGVDADCAGAAEPSRGVNRCAAGHRYRATVAAVSWLVAGTRRPVFGPGPTRPVRHLDARRARLHAVDGGTMGPYDQGIPAVVREGRSPARGSDGGRYR